MIAFIDDHRGAYGVEPICKVLPIAPSTYRERLAQRRDPARLSARARRDQELKPQIARVFAENFAVYGVRKDRATDSLPKRLSADLYYKAHNLLSSDKIPDHAGDFRLLDRRVVEVIRTLPERNRFMKGLFAWGGFKSASVEYVRAERTLGETKFRPWKLWTLALDGITSSSTVPLRIWTYVGGGIAALSFLYAFIIIAKVLVFGIAVPGYASLMVAILFFGGLQLLSLGILGEYVGRIMVEAKQRPLYIVRDTIGMAEPETARASGK